MPFGLHATVPLALAGFAVGIVVLLAATERLVDALVGVGAALRVAPFVVTAVLSGMEVENVGVGLAAGARGAADVALGTAYGGAVVLLCWALGLGAVIAPLRVRLPRATVLLVPASAVVAGLPACFAVTPRWSGAVLLAAFVAAMTVLVRASREHAFLRAGAAEQGAAEQGAFEEEALEGDALEEDALEDAAAGRRPLRRAIGWTLVGLAFIAAGGDVVAWGANGLIASLGLSAGFVGMVVTPLGVEAEEILRQVVPARRGRPDVSAGNAVGTVLWFLLFNLGLIALITPVHVPARVRFLDWPAVAVAAVVAGAFLLRGRLGRAEGAVLLLIGLGYAGLQLALN